jgi:hypothetical protein
MYVTLKTGQPLRRAADRVLAENELLPTVTSPIIPDLEHKDA